MRPFFGQLNYTIFRSLCGSKHDQHCQNKNDIISAAKIRKSNLAFYQEFASNNCVSWSSTVVFVVVLVIQLN